MTAATATAERVLRSPAEIRRLRIIGIIYLLLAAFVLIVFAIGTEGESTFRLAATGDRFELPDLILSAAGLSYTAAAFLAFLGGIQLTRQGVPVVSVSVPGRYTHSPAAIINRDDFKNTPRLVRAALSRLSHDTLKDRLRHYRCRGVGAHTACIRTKITIVSCLMIL